MISTSYDQHSTLHKLASSHACYKAGVDRSGLSGKHLDTILGLIRDGAFDFKLSPRYDQNKQSESNQEWPVTIVRFNKRPTDPEVASLLLQFFLVEEM